VDEPVERQGRCFESAVISRCRRGETVSGDVARLVPVRGGGVVVAAIDGAGHGREASRAASLAARVVEAGADAADDDVSKLMRACHAALEDTRGAAITLAHLSCPRSAMTWVGLGSVEGRVVSPGYASPRRDLSLRLLRGMAGHDMPSLVASRHPLRRGDLVTFASDGVAPGFGDRLGMAGPVSAVAGRILADHWNGDDDALVVVIRWLAGTGAKAS
jgi:negative regulator of sigma-B (phosphoserine phosphatase)